MSSSSLNIVKIPKEKSSSTNEDLKDLPRMPSLFLELIENKDKLKTNMVNSDYIPSDATSVKSIDFTPKTKTIENEKVLNTITEKTSKNRSSVNNNDDNESVIDISSEEEVSENEDLDDDDEASENEDDDEASDNEEDESIEGINYEDDITVDNNSSVYNENNNTSSSGKQKELQNFLNGTDNNNNVPRLSELEREGRIKLNKTIPNLNNGNFATSAVEEEDDEDLRREMLFKFSILKKSYRDAEIPNFSIHTPLRELNEKYETTLRHLTLDSTVDNYRNYLVMGFLLFETVFGYLLKLDLSGFASQQIMKMDQYNRLLLELGAKSYQPSGKEMPVEWRLLSLVAMNGCIFVVAKIINNRTNIDILQIMNQTGLSNGYNTPSSGPTTPSYNSFPQPHQPSAPERKPMKKPVFDFSTL